MHQCSADLQKTVSYGSTSSRIGRDVVWQLWKPEMRLKDEKQWPSSCAWRGCAAGGRHFQLKCKEICAEGKPELQMPENDCGKFCADGFAWNLIMPRYQTAGLGELELELQMKWPPRSPGLTSWDFFLWGYVKEQVFVPPLPLDIDELLQLSKHLTGTC
jgi:hypothetical protein